MANSKSKYRIDKEQEPEKWQEVFESAKKRTLKEIDRYCGTYSRPFKSSQLYLFIRHDLSMLGLRMSDFLDILDDAGDLYIQTLPKSGRRVILNEDIKEIAEASGPLGIPDYLALYEDGKLDYKPGEL